MSLYVDIRCLCTTLIHVFLFLLVILEDLWLRQREKPINEHLISQLLFYCEMNHKEDHTLGKCSGRPELMINQGVASDWLKIEHDVFQEKLRKEQKRITNSI